MHIAVSKLMKVIAFVATCALFLTVCVAVSPFAYAENAVVVTNDRELLSALSDGAERITIEYDTPSLSENIVISTNVAIDGGGAVLDLGEGYISVEATGTLTLSAISVRTQGEYAVRSAGKLVFGSEVSFIGTGGVLLTGAALSGDGSPVSFGEETGDALTVSGTSTLDNVYIWHFGSGVGVKLSSNDALTVRSAVTVISESGSAIAAADMCSPSVSIAGTAQLKAVAQSDGADGIDLGSGKLSMGDAAQLTVSAGASAVRCGSFDAAGKTAVDIEGGDGLYVGGDAKFSSSATVTISAAGDGITASDISFGDGAVLEIIGGESAINCNNIRFGASSSVTVDGSERGIISQGSIGFGANNDIYIDSSKSYCVYSGTQDGDIDFGSDCSAVLKSDACAIYSKGSVTFSVGSYISVTGGQFQPAVIIDGPDGNLNVSGAKLEIISFVGKSADVNCAVHVYGSVNIDNASTVSVTAYEQFAFIINSGKLSVLSDSKLYVSGGCAVYGENCDITLNSGGSLYAHGTVDSGIRLSSGSVTAGDGCVLFSQGARFGIELLGTGSLQLASCSDYTIRSTKYNAVYIENGSFNVSGIDRLSVYRIGEDDSTSLWCSDYSEDEPAWDNPCDIYADLSILAPNAEQSFSSGTPDKCDALRFGDADWNIGSYSCITQYTSRPIARPNQFSIPAGKTYSWQLYGYSYLGCNVTYELDNINCEGEMLLSSDGKLTYTAHNSVRGVQTFTYTVRDSEGVESLPVAVDILVNASKPPIAWNMSFDTGVDEQLIGNVTIRDYDGSISHVEIVSEPQHGEFIMGNDGTFIYTPNGLYSGTDSFSYYAVDAVGDKSVTAVATIFIGMDKIHRARNMTVITPRDETVNTALDIVLVQPKPKEDEPVEEVTVNEIIITSPPVYGTLRVEEDNTVTYIPYEGFAGADTFAYCFTAQEDFTSTEAAVTIAIIPGQQPDAHEARHVLLTGTKSTLQLTAEDLDGSVVSYHIAEQPKSGTLTLDAQTGEAVYTPSRGYSGTDSFTFFVTDDESLTSKTVIVELEVAGLVTYLKKTEKLTGAVLIAAGVLTAIVLLALLPVFAAKRRKKELEYYEKLERELYHDEFGDF